MYFKITNKEENHHGFQYIDGLNILTDDFNDDPNQSCCPGGLYFSDAANILKFYNYGVYLREVTLPTKNPNFCMIKDGDKWRANMIILGKRYELSDFDTIKYLIKNGADKNDALCISAKNGNLEMVQYLVENGANIHYKSDFALYLSLRNTHLPVTKYLMKNGANQYASDYYFYLEASIIGMDMYLQSTKNNIIDN